MSDSLHQGDLKGSGATIRDIVEVSRAWAQRLGYNMMRGLKELLQVRAALGCVPLLRMGSTWGFLCQLGSDEVQYTAFADYCRARPVSVMTRCGCWACGMASKMLTATRAA